jgi:hypothetical protein
LTREGHSSSCFRSFRVPSPEPLAASGKLLLPAKAFGPLRDTTRFRPLVAGHPKSHYVPPSGFLNLSAAFSESERHKLISSCNRVQGSLPFKDFSLRTAAIPHRDGLCPLVVTASLLEAAEHRFLLGLGQLRGFAPCEDAFFSTGV